MRNYGQVSPRFWNGTTGKRIRAMGAEAQVVALYLMTSPSSTMTGLYYLPIPTIAHDTGLTLEGASKALERLSEGGFCLYDEVEELLFVPEMARHQIAESLKPKDNRVKGIAQALAPYRRHAFCAMFLEKYAVAFSLPDGIYQGPTIGDARPLQAPSKALRSQEQDQEQKQDQESLAPACARDPRVPHPVTHRALALELLAEERDLIRQLREGEGIGKDSRSLPLGAGELDLVRTIAECAVGKSVEEVADDCRHVLALMVAEARAQNTLKWFDGHHWHIDRVKRALARTLADVTGKANGARSGERYHHLTGHEVYQDGKVQDF